MKSKSSLFMVAPVAVSAIVLVILFNPAMANGFADKNEAKGPGCTMANSSLSNSEQVGAKGFANFNRQIANSFDLSKLPGHFSSLQAMWVEKYNEQMRSASQKMADGIYVHRMVRPPTPGSANVDFQREIGSVYTDRRPAYVF